MNLNTVLVYFLSILDNTKITSLSSFGLQNLRSLSLTGVKNFWNIQPGFANIREVSVSDYNSYLCCAFHLKKYDRDYGKLDTSVGNTPTTQLSTIFSTLFTTLFTTEVTPTTSGHSTTVSISSTQNTNQSVNATTAPPTVTTTELNPWGKRKRRDSSGLGTSTTTKSGSFPGGGGFVPGTTATGSSPVSTESNGGGIFPGGGEGFATGTVSVPTKITHVNKTNDSVHTLPPPEDVVCRPGSDAFHPCEDLMGAGWLTAVCLIVGSIALVANVVVMSVIFLSEKRVNVTRFLMGNLAFADLCLGLYLFLLVCVSLSTTGEYYNHVRSWQYGAGCKVAGFLAVFSTELSVYTLALITVERFLAIVYAMRRNLRLSLRKAAKVMALGWLCALLTAILPLVGVNSYDQVAICLPFNINSTAALAYVTIILVINGGAFLSIAGLYIKMFLVVAVGPGHVDGGGPQRNDLKVAQRMAVLVLTDFICWAPIAMFGLMAAFGVPSIDVTDSKILLVFFFPLNSLCNPFLYAFFTKAFKREFFALLSRFGFCKMRALRYKGTFSSLMYSRSRSRTKRSTMDDGGDVNRAASASCSDMRTSQTFFGDAAGPNVRFAEGDVSMTGLSNLGFTGATSPNNDQVFFPPSPTSGTPESPRSVLKKSKACDERLANGSVANRDPNTGEGDSPVSLRKNSEGSVHGVEGISDRKSQKLGVSFMDSNGETTTPL